MPHAGLRGGLDEGPVLVAAVLCLGGGDHEERLDAVEHGEGRVPVRVVGGAHVQAESRGSGGVAHHQPRGEVGERGREQAAEMSGRAGESEHGCLRGWDPPIR